LKEDVMPRGIARREGPSILETIRASGRLTFCTDVGYPPMEFHQEGEPVGADVEIAAEIARRLGVEADFADEPVAGIIDALYAGRGDAIINAYTDNEMRRRYLAFVDYLSVGQTVLVPRGNPLGIRSVEDLAGRQVLVQADTSNEQSLRELDAANQSNGLPPMRIAAFKGTTAATTTRAAATLRRGEADADFLDVINATWNTKQHPEVELVGFVINEHPYGIGLRKTDVELQQEVLDAVKEMYAGGAIRRILEKWDLAAVALAGPDDVRLNG
jgi:polar amino acid transport system substrate-binding protein